MAQISFGTIAGGPVAGLPMAATAAVQSDRTLNQSVSRAVRALNDASYAGTGREITFSMDPGTRQPVIKVIDVGTKEVIHQWPSEYLLRIAEQLTAKTENSG